MRFRFKNLVVHINDGTFFRTRRALPRGIKGGEGLDRLGVRVRGEAGMDLFRGKNRDVVGGAGVRRATATSNKPRARGGGADEGWS